MDYHYKNLASAVYTVIYHISASAKFVHSFVVKHLNICKGSNYTYNNANAKFIPGWDEKDYCVHSIAFSFSSFLCLFRANM